MSDGIGYVVAVYRDSLLPEPDLGSDLCYDQADADFARDVLADETAEAGRSERYVVCELIPVKDD
jgi:hypothetical protein